MPKQEESCHYYYVVIEVELGENGKRFTFRDEGPGWESKIAAEDFARKIHQELRRSAVILLDEEWTDTNGTFHSRTHTVPQEG